jgi:hypothetical protein
MNVVKLCHNYWHTGSRHFKFYGGYRPCCFFQENKEDWKHILNCPSLDSSYHRDASWQKVKKAMQMWRLPADFWTALEKGLHHLPRDIKESTSPTLPFQISVNPIRKHLRAAFQEQNSIKWTNLLKRRMAHKWQQFATAHVRSKTSTYAHKNGVPNSSQHYGTIHFEYDNSAMMPSMETQTHKSNATN